MRSSDVPHVRWTSHTSPNGFYVVEHPVSWRLAREENIVNIFPPDESGSVTVSGYQRDPSRPDIGTEALVSMIGRNRVLSPLRRITMHGWSGARVEYQTNEPEGDCRWITVLAEYQRVMVLITANDLVNAMAERRHLYERIISSLRLRGAGATGAV